MIVNLSQLENYKNIFGFEKFGYLWNEFVEQSQKAWTAMEDLDINHKRSQFHNWRSSSLVFGMEDFASLCTKIEEDILKNRQQMLSKQINEAKICYEKSIDIVKQLLEKMEK